MFKKKKIQYNNWFMILPIILLIIVIIWSVGIILLVFSRDLITHLSDYNKFISVQQKQEALTTSIGNIINEPLKYQNKTVIIQGKFGGWQGYDSCDTNKTAMKNKTDSLIYDATGCLYMTNKVEVLSPKKELRPLDLAMINQDVIIKAKINLIGDKIILDQSTQTVNMTSL